MDNKVSQLIEAVDWDDIIPRLVLYAAKKIGRLNFNPDSSLNGLSEHDIAEEVVTNSIFKLIDGTRAWNPDEKPDILIHLMGVIKSEISHLYDSEEYATTCRFPTVLNENDNSDCEVEELINRAHPLDAHADMTSPWEPPDPETAVIQREQSARDQIVMNQLLDLVKDDKECEDIVLCIMEGLSKPREIAEALGVESAVIYNCKKRLQRIYDDIYQRMKKTRRRK